MESNYVIDYETPRHATGLSRNDVAILLADEGIDISSESLGCYERGVREPSPDLVVELAKIYREPFMTQRYCKYNCPIGEAYSYEILDKLDLNNISNVGLKVLQETREFYDVFLDLLSLLTNTTSKSDLNENELEMLKTKVRKMLDLEHSIETLKIALNNILDMEEIIREHNDKCIKRGYTHKKSPSEVLTPKGLNKF